MENIEECLNRIVSEGLIGENPTEIAAALALPSRSSVIKIRDKKAGGKAISNFCELLEKRFYIDEGVLNRIWYMFRNTDELRRLVKEYGTSEAKLDAFVVIRNLVAHDYSIFGDNIPEFNLKDLQNLESSGPEAYFTMLAYYYIKYGDANYYVTGKSHRERCATIMEGLGERFIEIYPENGVAGMSAYIYSKSEAFNGETPTLWSLVGSIAMMLQYFATPVNTIETTYDRRLLQGMTGRTYFKGKDDNLVILALAIDGKIPGCGWYDIFKIDRNSGKFEDIAQIYFLSESIMTIRMKPVLSSQMGVYEWDGKTIDFTWVHEGEDPSGLGNKWEKLELANSQSLRELDRSLSDDALRWEMLRSEGLEEVPGYKIADVNISRQRLTIKLENGKEYCVSIEEWPFLRNLKPSEPVEIYREISTGRVFVVWTEVLQSIPLNLFTASPYYTP